MNRPGAAGPDVIGQDRHDRSAFAALDHVTADGTRTVERAVEHDSHHGVPAFGREVLGAADEVAGGVVDEDVDVSEVFDGPFDELVDLIRIPDVDLHDERVEPRVPQLRRSGFEVGRVPAADDDAGAQRAEALGHGKANPRAAARHHRHPILQHRRTKHSESEYRHSTREP
jgi:hypothetical protein